MATPTVTRSIEEIYREWRPRILETARNRDSFAAAIDDAENHGAHPSAHLSVYEDLQKAAYDANNAIHGFSRECQVSGFPDYAVSHEGKIAYSLWAPALQASIIIMRAQNLISSGSASSSSSESASSAPPSPSRNNNVFAVRARHHGMAPTNVDRDHLLSLLRSRSQPMPEQPFHLPPLSSASPTSTWHPTQRTPGRVIYPGDPCYDQLKHHHLYERNPEDGTLRMIPRHLWSEVTSRRDREANERLRGRGWNG
ncbi:hypothetical protein JCM5353_007656 [Sporobolomyces roseus]